MHMRFEDLLGDVRVIPVITIPDSEFAVPLAQALVAGGLTVLEITLRSEAALASIARIAVEVPAAVVGAGTVSTPQQYRDARSAGAQFVVAPGCTDALAAAAAEAGGAFLPGAVTPSEILRVTEHGITLMKFFPAEANGGIEALKALAGPFPGIRFCPTGGVDLARANDYLALDNVDCVGGTWMVPLDLIERGDWDAIAELALEASRATRTTSRVTV